MKCISTAVAAAVLATAGAASAQTTINPGQTLSGQLSSSDPTLDDDSHFDCFALRTRQGARYRINLRSDDFDTYLVVSSLSCEGEAADFDDDGGGGTNSQVEIAGRGEALYIRANSLGSGETGRYQLSVTEMGAGSPKQTAATAISWGQSLRGDLSSSDALASDDSFYDCVSFTGQTGQRAVVELSSSAFDAYASLHAGAVCEGEALETDDDGAGGTDARIDTTLPRSGAYSVRANSLMSGQTGPYQFRLSGAAGASSPYADMYETEACIYRPGSQRLEAGRGKRDQTLAALMIDGVETPQERTGVSQAEGRDWFVNSQPIRIGGRTYVKYGLPRVLRINEVEYLAEHDGVVFAAETGVNEARPEVLYALVRTVGCEFQPYERQD